MISDKIKCTQNFIYTLTDSSRSCGVKYKHKMKTISSFEKRHFYMYNIHVLIHVEIVYLCLVSILPAIASFAIFHESTKYVFSYCRSHGVGFTKMD